LLTLKPVCESRARLPALPRQLSASLPAHYRLAAAL